MGISQVFNYTLYLALKILEHVLEFVAWLRQLQKSFRALYLNWSVSESDQSHNMTHLLHINDPPDFFYFLNRNQSLRKRCKNRDRSYSRMSIKFTYIPHSAFHSSLIHTSQFAFIIVSVRMFYRFKKINFNLFLDPFKRNTSMMKRTLTLSAFWNCLWWVASMNAGKL